MDRSETPLQFAVRFAQMDFSELREGDWLNLREELDARFFYAGLPRGATGHYDVGFTGGVWPVPKTDPRKLTRQEMRTLQSECKKMIESWAAMQTIHEEYARVQRSGDPTSLLELGKSKRPTVYSGKFVIQYDALAYPNGGGAIVVIADLVPVFLFTLSMILQRGGAETLRLCRECGKLLSKRGRRKFCSPQCLDRVTKRNYRNRKKERAHGKKK